MEVCNQNTWSIACANAFGVNEARVICRQLGFSPNYVNYTQHVLISDLETKGETTTPTCSMFVGCFGNEENLSGCRGRSVARRRRRGLSEQPTCARFLGGRRRRGLSDSMEPACAYQAGVQCGGIIEQLLGRGQYS